MFKKSPFGDFLLLLFSETEQFISYFCSFLEFQIGTRHVHLEFQTLDIDSEFFFREFTSCEYFCLFPWNPDFFYGTDDCRRSDTVNFVIAYLYISSAIGFSDRVDHRDRFFTVLGIHNHMSIYISSGTSDNLEKG